MILIADLKNIIVAEVESILGKMLLGNCCIKSRIRTDHLRSNENFFSKVRKVLKRKSVWRVSKKTHNS